MAAQPATLLMRLTGLTMLQVINCGNKWREVRFSGFSVGLCAARPIASSSLAASSHRGHFQHLVLCSSTRPCAAEPREVCWSRGAQAHGCRANSRARTGA